MSRPEPLLYLDDHRGIYIPRDFVACTRSECITGPRPEALEALRNPDGEWYWEAWDEVLQEAVLTDLETGVKYRLYQEGALWLIPDGMESKDDGEWYWPEDES